jgi:phosphoribosyl-ATP pyrophosphohydrolase/phosphoribosyl-AMP cyclohydrolase
MNREALATTRATGRVTFFSRRRSRLWTKGETSGNWLEVKEILLDCDGDALLLRSIPHGPTCHTGAASCFREPERWNLGEVLTDLYDVIGLRKTERLEDSYTAQLFNEGHSKIVRKVAEEALELGLELIESGDHLAEEASDLLYHTLVLLAAGRVQPDDLAAILSARRRGDQSR